MSKSGIGRAIGVGTLVGLLALRGLARADGSLQNVNHVVIIMQENHSFDNYFGALPYATGTPYHGGAGACDPNDHACVDGLTCTRVADSYTCTNSNVDDDTSTVAAFHDPNLCVFPDLQHNWPGSHREANYSSPSGALISSPNDGFVLVNDAEEQIDNGETPVDDETMGFYTEADLPFYYSLAQTFAISDRYFCSVVGPTFPNRSYGMAATSFGHLTTNEILPPIPNSYKPITGTIFDLLDQNGVVWKNYYNNLPTSWIFRFRGPEAVPIANFFVDAAAGTLPPVSFVDPSLTGPTENDEHPPTNIRAGEFFVWQVVNAIRNSPNWNDTVIFFTYDEHGGSYDHVAPPPAPQGGNRNPDGIEPGQCADLSNPPASTQPGGGVQCSVSQSDAANICPAFTPTGPYPANCADFDQLGFRVPFIVVSPFAKPQYVSHTVGDHTSMLAFIEKRFLGSAHLTARDANADTLEDMFDFDNSPSLNAIIPMAPAPSPTDPGCSTTTTTLAVTTTTTSTTTSTTTTTFGCGLSPVAGCQADAPTKGHIQLGRGKVTWRWTSSGTVAASDFGTPTTTTEYAFCVYDASGVKLSALIPPDGTCGSKPCWKENRPATVFTYANKAGTPDGVKRAVLRSGAAGKAKLQVSGGGPSLHLPTLPLTTPVRVQLRQSSSNTCWEATFGTASTSTSTMFRARSD